METVVEKPRKNWGIAVAPYFVTFAPMDARYPKSQKLKSRKTIEQLFAGSQSVSKYPLRLVYMETPEAQEAISIGVSVSKKYFKKAVDRNYFKRVLRETYRLNKSILLEASNKPFAFMLLYQTKERLAYSEIHEKTIALFNKFAEKIGPQPPDTI